MLEHLPPQLHLILATREDPPLPLARLRAKDEMTELRAADLRFDSSEAAQFLNQVMGLSLSAEDLSALESRTEGWIAGLQLAAISVRSQGNATSFIETLTGSHRLVLDYLIEEVLEQQAEDLQAFLLKTAILDRMTGSLCDALTGQDDGQATLEMLDRTNLFMIPLDGERIWYRYHHLFADFLRQRLRRTYLNQIPGLHDQASEWYERFNLPADSIRHALAGEDFERAADLAELAWPGMSGSFQSITWLGWLKKIPDHLVHARLVLCVGYAWAYLNCGNLEAAEVSLKAAERWLEPDGKIDNRKENSKFRMVIVDEEQFRMLPTSLATARAYHAQAVGDTHNTVKYTQRVLNLLPEGNHPRRGDATALLALAYWASGELEKAHRTFTTGLAAMPPLDLIIGTFVLVDIRMSLGLLHEAERACVQALQLAADHGQSMPLGTEDVYSALSKLHREQGDLEAAAQDLLESKNLGEQIELPDWQYRWCIAEARRVETQGALDDALNLLDEAQRAYVRTPLPDVCPINAMKARIWATQGRINEALAWANERNLGVNDELTYLREFEHITLARILIRKYKAEQELTLIEQTITLLGRLLRAADDGHRTGSVIEILILQAIAHEAQGEIHLALKPLEHALALAEPQGYVRLFFDEGLPMARMLYQTLARDISPKYLQRLLAAFPNFKEQEAEALRCETPKSEMVEPLSKRELEVLQLIDKGLTNQEIATRLFITRNTVKAHTRNIFGKPGVTNRSQAGAWARALGILSSG